MAAPHPGRRAAAAATALCLLLLAAAGPSAAHGAPNSNRRHGKKGNNGSNSASCSALDKKCGFLSSAQLAWQQYAAVYVLESDGSTVTCAPQDDDGLASCEFVNERSELLLKAACPGGGDYAVFQSATGQLIDVQPDGSATFDPWIPGITQSQLGDFGSAGFEQYSTVGGVVPPEAGEAQYWSVEIWCMPSFNPPAEAARPAAAGKGVRRAGVASAAASARARARASAKAPAAAAAAASG